MADTVDFELVSPERLLLSRPVGMVVVPGSEGDFGVLPGHAPLISTVRPGVITIFENGAVTDRIFVAGGFAEVTAGRCTVLAEEAVPVENIDRADADTQVQYCREELASATDEAARAAIMRRLAVAEARLASVAHPVY